MDNSDNPIIIYNSHYFLYIMFYHNLKFTSSTGNHLISPPSSRLGLLGRQHQALGHLQRGALHRQQRQLARHLRGQAMARWHDTWPNSGWTGVPLTCHYDERSIKHWNSFSAKKYCGLFNLRQEMKVRTQQEEHIKWKVERPSSSSGHFVNIVKNNSGTMERLHMWQNIITGFWDNILGFQMFLLLPNSQQIYQNISK